MMGYRQQRLVVAGSPLLLHLATRAFHGPMQAMLCTFFGGSWSTPIDTW